MGGSVLRDLAAKLWGNSAKCYFLVFGFHLYGSAWLTHLHRSETFLGGKTLLHSAEEGLGRSNLSLPAGIGSPYIIKRRDPGIAIQAEGIRRFTFLVAGPCRSSDFWSGRVVEPLPEPVSR